MKVGRKNDENLHFGDVSRPSRAIREIVLAAVLLPLLLSALVVVGDSVEITERYKIDFDQIAVNDPPPTPATDLIRTSLAEQPFEGLSKSLFDPDLGFAVRQVFESNPWVRRVVSVRREFPRGLAVKLDYREPFAAIERDGAYFFADRDGELLPVISDTPVLPPPFITISGNGESGADSRGFTEAWFADAVHEGVEILKELHRARDAEVFEYIGVRAIDVANFRRRLDRSASEALLVTNRTWSDESSGVFSKPVVVRWGRSRAHRMGRSELPVEQKLDNLLAMIRVDPALDGIDQIDVRFATPYYRQFDRELARK